MTPVIDRAFKKVGNSSTGRVVYVPAEAFIMIQPKCAGSLMISTAWLFGYLQWTLSKAFDSVSPQLLENKLKDTLWILIKSLGGWILYRKECKGLYIKILNLTLLEGYLNPVPYRHFYVYQAAWCFSDYFSRRKKRKIKIFFRPFLVRPLCDMFIYAFEKDKKKNTNNVVTSYELRRHTKILWLHVQMSRFSWSLKILMSENERWKEIKFLKPKVQNQRTDETENVIAKLLWEMF